MKSPHLPGRPLIAVKRLTRAYDPRGLLERVGSYDSATVGSGTLESEVRFEYYDFGNLAKHGQSHAGSVGGSPPGVAYTHEDGFYNNTRLTAMTYPNGRINKRKIEGTFKNQMPA